MSSSLAGKMILRTQICTRFPHLQASMTVSSRALLAVPPSSTLSRLLTTPYLPPFSSASKLTSLDVRMGLPCTAALEMNQDGRPSATAAGNHKLAGMTITGRTNACWSAPYNPGWQAFCTAAGNHVSAGMSRTGKTSTCWRAQYKPRWQALWTAAGNHMSAGLNRTGKASTC